MERVYAPPIIPQFRPAGGNRAPPEDAIKHARATKPFRTPVAGFTRTETHSVAGFARIQTAECVHPDVTDALRS